MASGRYHFDRRSFSFRRERLTVLGAAGKVFRFLLYSALMAVAMYTLFALVLSTDTERRLKRENRMLSRVYPQMLEREELVEDVIEGLQLRDNSIYQDIFHAEAPGLNPFEEATAPLSDTIADRDLVNYTDRLATSLEATAAGVEANLRRVTGLLSERGTTLPPLSSPLPNVSFAQIGASTGEKMNPFYKVPSSHGGLDIIASQGTPVLSALKGTVSDVIHSRKGLGNVVEVSHEGGYVTRYCHLGDIFVHKGQKVSCGTRLGEVGISGNSYATHLHYEVLKDGVVLDPVHYMAASVTPSDYADMLYMSAYTGQSLD